MGGGEGCEGGELVEIARGWVVGGEGCLEDESLLGGEYAEEVLFQCCLEEDDGVW